MKKFWRGNLFFGALAVMLKVKDRLISMSLNGVMMQYFEWYVPEDGKFWQQTALEAQHLAQMGITAVWLPPAFKGQAGIHDVGYGVYDVYDLGEFDQKGTVRTKYGTKTEYLAAIKALQQAGIQVYTDIVLNHMMGADATEQVLAVEDASNNRLQRVSGDETIEAWTVFTFPGRQNKYSDFKWNHNYFDGVDWDQRTHKSAIYNFEGNSWETDVDHANNNYDYLMGADLNFSNQVVIDQLNKWGQWYIDTCHMDGFRIDAVKHISSTFYKNWLWNMRMHNHQNFFAVGEYWSGELDDLRRYVTATAGCMSLFDVPLHLNFFKACNQSGTFDMAHLLDGTLVQDNPTKAVTFVENHDTQPGQALQTVVADWFKPLAYGVILLRPQGYPCIFYGDYYGDAEHQLPCKKELLERLCQVRRDKVYGFQHDDFDHFDVVGWTLEGDAEHPGSGVAVLLSDGPGGEKNMYIGLNHIGQTFYDCLGNCQSGFGLWQELQPRQCVRQS